MHGRFHGRHESSGGDETAVLMAIPSSFENLIEALRGLPGVGPKSAQRMAYHLLQSDRPGAQRLAGFIKNTQVHDAVLKAMGFRR